MAIEHELGDLEFKAIDLGLTRDFYIYCKKNGTNSREELIRMMKDKVATITITDDDRRKYFIPIEEY